MTNLLDLPLAQLRGRVLPFHVLAGAPIQAAAEAPTDSAGPGDVWLVVLTLLATYVLSRALTPAAQALSTRFERHRLALLQLVPFMRTALWLLAGYVIVAGVFEPSPQSLLGFFVAAGLAIGLGAQDVLKNIFGGVLILIDRPFRVGDLVDLGDQHGEVVGIGLRATRIFTRDDAIVAVPNARVVNQPVRNANSGAPDCMVVTELFLPGGIDPALVQKLCHEAAASSPYLYAAKPIRVRVADEFRERFLTKIRIEAYVYDHRLETAFATDVAQRAKRAFLNARLLPADRGGTVVDTSDVADYLEPAPAAGADLSPTDAVEAS